MSTLSQVDADSNAPLTDQERALTARLLSDPFSYPQTLKTWMVSFLEGSDMSLTTDAILGLAAFIKKTVPPAAALMTSFGAHAASANVPPGFVLGYAGDDPPSGALLCDGRAIDRAAFPRLFAVIGTRWGNGNGTTTFNLPDMSHVKPPGNNDIRWLISF